MAAASVVSESQLWFSRHARQARELAAVSQDRDHLQGLDSTFALTADVVLYADAGKNCLTGFPVHREIISAQSPVIFQLLEAERSNGVSEQQPLRLPLSNDRDNLYSNSAMRAAVSYLYSQSCGGSQPCGLRVDLQLLPTHAECMRLFHHYGMENTLMALDKDLQGPLEQLVKTDVTTFSSCHLDEFVKFAIDAEDCGCMSILKVCEALITCKCLDHQTTLRCAVGCGLSQASTVRVHEALYAARTRSQSQTVQAMMEALRTSADEAQAQCNELYYHGMCCPRCDRRLKISKKKNVVHKGNKPCKCTWPRQQTYRPITTPTRFEDIQKLLDGVQM